MMNMTKLNELGYSVWIDYFNGAVTFQTNTLDDLLYSHSVNITHYLSACYAMRAVPPTFSTFSETEWLSWDDKLIYDIAK
jgi:hypothetical protein